ncbi:LacI family DNA-binding transcriptional regulator [Pseudolysinimonas sp.]|uniref:LacI family DNA-binding transcriptional regulator n=1 Tax=Pseudolysinimonas sp. TaxID=2680009 RepID=UPI003F80F72F
MARPAGLNGAGSRGDAGRRATILDVAAAAGVSRQTVTRAMNGMGDISPATRARVLAAAEELGYRPSRFGRGLVTGGERQLGLVLDDLRNPYFPELAAAVVARAAEHGWNVLLVDAALAEDPTELLAALGRQVDAVVGYIGVRVPDWLREPGALPVVTLGEEVDPLLGGIRLDDGPAIAALAAHLAGAGVRRPAVLGPGEPGHGGRTGRLAAALASQGMPVRTIAAGAVSAEAAAAAATPHLTGPDAVDAVVAFNDIMALGVLAACRRAGVAVPDDVRVVGIDGLPLGELVSPTLTTLALDLDEVARDAVELVVGGRGSRAVLTVRHRLVLRESA